MKLTSSWVKEWLRRTMLNDQQIVEALEQAGIEVEQVISSKEIDKKVVVGLVKKVAQHPGADRLHLVDVEVGESTYRVVCGAPNVREGLKVAFAQIGTTLPGGDTIKKAKLRGEASEGMICSASELEIGTDHNGIMELSSDVAVGTSLCDLYPADSILDIKTQANRFDLLSVMGLSREVAAMTTAELAPLSPPAIKTSVDGPAVVPVAAAARYMLARVKVDQSMPSPRLMIARLQASGMRAVNPVVDATNYAMLELGQPFHAFDAAKVTLPIAVRLAKPGELLETLDGVARKLTGEDLVIADVTGPIALAGLMGGATTEVDANTTEILLEAAAFDGTVIRKMAKRHGLRTEASARIERGLPVELPGLALPHAVGLLEQIAGGELIAVTDQQNQPGVKVSIELPLPRLVKLLGFGITHKEALGVLHKLQIDSDDSHKNIILVPEVPWWRPDLRMAEDLVEEIVRVIGYDRVPSSIPVWRPRVLKFDRLRAKRRRIQDLMYGAGLFEVMSYSFVSSEQLEGVGADSVKHLKLKNPMSLEQAYLRSSLLPSHLAVLAKNRLYAREIGYYEISKVFIERAAGEQPEEPAHLGTMICRPEAAYAHAKGILDALSRELNVNLQFEARSQDVCAPGRAAAVRLGDRMIGWIGQIHPERVRALKVEGEVAYFEVDLAPLMELCSTRLFAGTERFPSMVRDLTVVIPREVMWQAVAEALTDYQVVFVSDYYGAGLPAGHKGMTIRLTLANPDRTPTEAEAQQLESSVLARLQQVLMAQTR